MHPLATLITGLGVALALATTPVLAFGPHGHQTVGGIADQLIAGTPTAKKVRAILGGNLQMASVWADCARSVELKGGKWAYTNPGEFKDCATFENAASQAALVAFVKRNASFCGFMAGKARCRHTAWHFTDVAIQQPRYEANLPGTAPNDLVQAIAACITVLQGGKAPEGFNIASQREALRLLAHLVGDVHQPLHVGAIYLDDAGKPLNPANEKEAHDHGNGGGGSLLLKGRKLHGLWDDVPGKITAQLLAGAGATEARQLKPSTGPLAQWPTLWASDTLGEASNAFKGLKFGAKTDRQWPATASEPAYRLARENLQHAQLVKGGARLAQLLTALLP